MAARCGHPLGGLSHAMPPAAAGLAAAVPAVLRCCARGVRRRRERRLPPQAAAARVPAAGRPGFPLRRHGRTSGRGVRALPQHVHVDARHSSLAAQARLDNSKNRSGRLPEFRGAGVSPLLCLRVRVYTPLCVRMPRRMRAGLVRGVRSSPRLVAQICTRKQLEAIFCRLRQGASGRRGLDLDSTSAGLISAISPRWRPARKINVNKLFALFDQKRRNRPSESTSNLFHFFVKRTSAHLQARAHPCAQLPSRCSMTHA